MRIPKSTVILLHGASRYSRPNLAEKWLPVLEQNLGENYILMLPEMPTPDSPDRSEWLVQVGEIVKPLEGEFYLVGHSLGGSVALQFLARSESRNGQVFVVASPFWCGQDDAWQYEQFRLTESDIKALESYDIYLYHGTEDEIVPFTHMAEYKNALPWSEMRSYEGMNHIDPSDAFLRDLAFDITRHAL